MAEIEIDTEFRGLSLSAQAPTNAKHLNVSAIDSLADLHYSPLRDPERDIRLVELLPGECEDDIRVNIHQATLSAPAKKETPRMSVTQVQQTLPPGWRVTETNIGKYIFDTYDDGCTQWTHPDPNFDHYKYALGPENITEPKFEAISYAWGSDVKTSFVVVEEIQALGNANQQPIRTKLPVTDSLLQALQHLRDTKISRMLWVDAICIDQADELEKSYQVSRMGDIYRMAYRVIVWLGPEADLSSHALSVLEYIGLQVEVDYSAASLVVRSPEATEREWWRNSFQLPYTQDTWDAIDAILDRSWFSRLWVAQEIQLASKQPGAVIQCGSDITASSLLLKGILCLFQKESYLPSKLGPSLVNAYFILTSNTDRVLRELFTRVAIGRKCRDQRDRIYGLLGIAPRRFAAKTIPNYTETNSAIQVYKAAALLHARQVQRLELFNFCHPTGNGAMEVPSWVPDLSRSTVVSQYMVDQVATTTSRAHIAYDDAVPELLNVLGVHCAVVKSVSVALPRGFDHRSAVRLVRQWQPRDLDTAKYHPTGESLRKAFAITLTFGSVEDRWRGFDCPSLNDWARQDYDDALFGGNWNDRDCATVEESSTTSPEVLFALQSCHGRAFMQLSDDYIGMAPADTEQGRQCIHALITLF
jgi:hypothetical protein